MFRSICSVQCILYIVKSSGVYAVPHLHFYDLLLAQPDLVPELSAGADEPLLLGEELPEVLKLCLSRIFQQDGLNLRENSFIISYQSCANIIWKRNRKENRRHVLSCHKQKMNFMAKIFTFGVFLSIAFLIQMASLSCAPSFSLFLVSMIHLLSSLSPWSLTRARQSSVEARRPARPLQ